MDFGGLERNEVHVLVFDFGVAAAPIVEIDLAAVDFVPHEGLLLVGELALEAHHVRIVQFIEFLTPILDIGEGILLELKSRIDLAQPNGEVVEPFLDYLGGVDGESSAFSVGL